MGERYDNIDIKIVAPSGAPSDAPENVVRIDVLLENARGYLGEEECARLEDAYEFARAAHDGQLRKSGEPFIMHPVEVAIILSELHMDIDTLIAAVLHDTVEDTACTLEDVTERFGSTVAELVDGVTKISQIEVTSLTEQQANNLRKMILATSRDVRIIVIKLADRLHNMRTLMALKEDRRIFKARETREIYAPFANLLGIGSIKWELEDLSFFYLEPDKYQKVQKMVSETREAREAYLAEAMQQLRDALDEAGLEDAKISGRPKHLYSIYKKMNTKDKDFSEIYDLIGLRIIVQNDADCYKSLGAVHSLWHPMSDRFKDYIATPKSNGYKSIHTTVMGPAARPLEVQIRTEEMHRMNEYGVAAHWRYKQAGEKDKAKKAFEQDLAWLRPLLELARETDDPSMFKDELRDELVEPEVFCFTPKGEIVKLRAGATPLDFAYAIHTEVGNHCVGAKVNGAIVPLTSTLKTYDRVEIITQKNAHPSKNWVSVARTPRARNKIRAYFSKMSRNDDLERGRDILTKQMRRDGITQSAGRLGTLYAQVAEDMGYKSSDDMLIAVGAGKMSAKQVSHRLLHIVNKEQTAAAAQLPIDAGAASTLLPERRQKKKAARSAHSPTGVVVRGLDGVYVRLSHCCNPLPGDDIIGFTTRGRGVSVHRADCPNAVDLMKNPERIIDVYWQDDVASTYQVEIVIEAVDRLRLLQDTVMFLADQGVNIINSSTVTHADDIVEMRFLFEVSEAESIERILEQIRGIEGVFEASRTLPGTSADASSSVAGKRGKK